MAVTELAGDFDSQVFRSDAEFFPAVTAGGIECFGSDARAGQINLKLTIAVLAGDANASIFAVDAKLFRAVWTDEKIAANFDVNHVVNLLQLKELRHFDVAAMEIRVQ